MLRIAILAHSLRVAGGIVVGTNFIRCLANVASDHKYLISVPSGSDYENIPLPSGSKYYIYSGSNSPLARLIFDNLTFPKVVNEFHPDVVLKLGISGRVNLQFKQAILLQDSHLLYNEKHYEREVKFNKFKLRYFKYCLKKALKRTDIVFCQTPVTRMRFAEVFHYPIEQIKIFPNGISGFIQTPKDQVCTPEVLKEPEYYNLLFLAKFYAHKNLEILLDLFSSYPDELKNVRCIITVAPNHHSNCPKFLKEIKRRNLQHKIINVGPLAQSELAGYFYNSDALFFPTLLESFSGTYLEAMYFGLPILTSDIDFAHYICGDAALYFDPWDPSDVIDKLCRLKGDLDVQKNLIGKGKTRVSTFFRGWEEITSEIIKELEYLATTK